MFVLITIAAVAAITGVIFATITWFDYQADQFFSHELHEETGKESQS